MKVTTLGCPSSDQLGIALFVYNRPAHTKQVIEGLRVNRIKSLYIFSDAPKSTAEAAKVQQVREIIHAIDWCSVTIIEQQDNIGLDPSIRFGIDFVFKKHSRIIVLEDDCVPMPSLFDYMTSCFNQYQSKKQVMNINACGYPFSIPKSITADAFFGNRISTWGWGTWKDRWETHTENKNLYLEVISNPALKAKIDSVGIDLIKMLEINYRGLDDNWDIFWASTVILSDGLCVNPVQSHIRLIGHDGTGVHCGESDFYDTYTLCTSKKSSFSLPSELIVIPEIKKRIHWISYGRKDPLIPFLYNKVASRIRRIAHIIAKATA